MDFDAVILAGGRSARLSGVPKAGLLVNGSTLLELALHAAGGASRTVVVGPDPGTLPDGVLNCREEPAFAGPAAAIAAGLSALAAAAAAPRRAGGSAATGPVDATGATGAAPARWTLVLACDMPRAASAVGALLAAAGFGTTEDHPGSTAPSAPSAPTARSSAAPARTGSLMAVSADGRRQPLLGLYDTAALQRSVADAARRGALENASVFALLANLEVRDVLVPDGSTDDVDTWDDASALGVSARGPAAAGTTGPASAADHDFGGKR